MAILMRTFVYGEPHDNPWEPATISKIASSLQLPLVVELVEVQSEGSLEDIVDDFGDRNPILWLDRARYEKLRYAANYKVGSVQYEPGNLTAIMKVLKIIGIPITEQSRF